MTLRALFEGGRRREIQDALKRGDVDSLLRRTKPAPDFRDEFPAGVSYPLILGMPLKVEDDCTFRLLGIEAGKAVVTLENADGLQKFRARTGERREIKFRCGGAVHHVFIVAKEKMDPSGQTVMTVDLVGTEDVR